MAVQSISWPWHLESPLLIMKSYSTLCFPMSIPFNHNVFQIKSHQVPMLSQTNSIKSPMLSQSVNPHVFPVKSHRTPEYLHYTYLVISPGPQFWTHLGVPEPVPVSQRWSMRNVSGYPLVNMQRTTENHNFSWVNSLFLWPLSIAMLNFRRV